MLHIDRVIRSINDESAVTDLRFINDNSRLKKKVEKKIHHALEDIVGLKQDAFYRHANTARRDFLLEKLLKALLGIVCKPSTSHLQILMRVACYARTHIMMLHSEFCAVWLSLSDVTGKKNFAH